MALHALILTFVLFLASVCHGKPVGTSAAASYLMGRDQYSFCDARRTYYNQVGPASPLASDCQTMIDRIQGGGVYSVTLDGTVKQFLSYNSCHLSFQGSASGSPTVNVGNKDIITYVLHVIHTMKSSDGRVGAYGDTRCRKVDAPDSSDDNMRTARWTVY